ncbi:MAG: hypothetical protein J7M18_02665 [Candidatus Eremiobacteraeota bacterium]|nr:hypothetical protein [Candidatus Eremiobacteraeota bacterium]
MKIVPVKPNYNTYIIIITPPLGLGYLAGYLKKHGIEVKIIDALKNRLNPEELLYLDRAVFLVLDVLPGSELWDRLKGQFEPNWRKNSFKEPEWIPDGLTRKQIMKAQGKAFRQFYLRPGIFLNFIKSIKPKILWSLLKRVVEYGLIRI